MRDEPFTNLSDIDPAQVDVATDPKRKPAKRQVQPMPKMLEPWAKKAEARMKRRPASPGIMLEPTDEFDQFEPASPHDNDEVWQLQIHDAFGTRSPATVRVFIEQLRSLCGQTFDHETKRWRPSETEITAAVNFINSVQPRNEPEAALAAQMLAVHLMSMRMSAQALRTGDPHSTSLAGKLARTYAIQMDTMRQLRSRRRAVRQHITVSHEKHIHNHSHQHLTAWGSSATAFIPPALPGDQHAPVLDAPAQADRGRPAVSGEVPHGEVVPISRRARKAGL